MTRVRSEFVVAPSTAPVAAERHRAAVAAMSRRQVRAVRAVVVGALAIGAAVLALIVGVISSWWAAPVTFAVALALFWYALVSPRIAKAEDRVLGFVGPLRDAEVLGEARLLNLVDGLVPSTGVSRPRCLVADDPARNVLVVGRSPGHSRIVFTSGLLDSVTRMELEGLVACALVAIRDGILAAPTLALAVGGARLLRVAGPPADAAPEDLAAVGLTRYPPGLAAAFRRILGGGPPARTEGTDAIVDRFWLAQPGDPAALAARAEVLEEL